MHENGMTIHYQGKDYPLTLAEAQADTLRKFAIVAENIPPAPAILRGPRQQERARSMEAYETSATLDNMIPVIADLDENNRVRLNVFLDILTAGREEEEGRNWIFETIDRLLFHVRAEGPYAANGEDPRDALVDLAGNIETFWYWINEAKSTLENHPQILHQCIPRSPVVLEAIPEPVTTNTKPKPRRAGKTGKQ